ncbi:MAG TPA: hypothetical protein VGK48_08300 [Terriglobia bacterium]|jgi:uncharacterized membrane protein
MENAVYCLASNEPQANEILTHLRNLGFSASEVSILLKDKKTKNISVKEDAIRGARKGGIAGGVLGAIFGLTALSVPAVGALLVAGPFLAALGGAAVGGVVGGLAGGSGALTHVGIPEEHTPRLEQKIHAGAILIAVHSDDPARLDRALRVFKSSGADEIYGEQDLAA